MSGFDITISGGGEIADGWRTNDPIIPSGGYGGHPVAARPKKSALTIYEGRAPFQLMVPMLLWRGVTKNSNGQPEAVEKDRKALEAMASTAGQKISEAPPAVTIKANFPLPIPPAIAAGAQWWIEDLAWGEERRNSPGLPVDPGHLIWKLVTVTLLEWTEDDVLGGGGSPPKVKTNRAHTYKVRKGDTLHSIAASQLGNATRWGEIGRLNGIRSSGDLAAKVGKTIKIPATTSAGWAQPTSKTKG